MKTAMQEVLSLVEQMYKDAKSIMVESAMNDVINIITQEGLPKEKEQMLDFGLYVKKNGWVGCKIEDLYEDYNNQNK